MSTLTIRNLDEAVKQKLRLRAAAHQTSMEAEAREIIRSAVEDNNSKPVPTTLDELRIHLKDVRGKWKEKGSTAELTELTRH